MSSLSIYVKLFFKVYHHGILCYSILVTDEPEKLISAITNRADDQIWDERLLGYSIQVDVLSREAAKAQSFFD